MRHPTKVTYKTVQVGDLDVFHREVGSTFWEPLRAYWKEPLLDAGHFAVETNGAEIATLMRDFLARH